MSGMRPTGDLHLGHLVGVLTQWVDVLPRMTRRSSRSPTCTRTRRSSTIRPTIRAARNEMVAVWLAAGVDPERGTIFLQSAVPEIAELHTLLSMITPVSWLERVPTYKGQIEALGQKIATYGFLGYPLLQLCDIAIVRGQYVPVGRDQVAHLELGREIVRRFNHLYGDGREISDRAAADSFGVSRSSGNRRPQDEQVVRQRDLDLRRRRDDDQKGSLDGHRSAQDSPRRSGASGDLSRSLRSGASSIRCGSTPSRRSAARERWAACKTRTTLPSSSTSIFDRFANGTRPTVATPRSSSGLSPREPVARARSPRAFSPTSSARCGLSLELWQGLGDRLQRPVDVFERRGVREAQIAFPGRAERRAAAAGTPPSSKRNFASA